MSTLSSVQNRTLMPLLPVAPLLSNTTMEMSTELSHAHARTLALTIETLGDTSTVADILLRFSPRIFSRPVTVGTKSTTWFFLDLSSHLSWIERTFGDEVHLIESVVKALGSVGHTARIAIADTPQAAQAFAAQHGYWISAPDRTRDDLDRLPLTSLLSLEGLEAWSHPSRVEAVANFFSLLGFHKIGDIRPFTEASFQERWGLLGEKIYRRIQGHAAADRQPIQPFVPTDPLRAFVHLDHPVSMVSLLLHEVETAMKTLFARLEGRRLVVRRLRVCLRCEYSGHEHVFSIEPSTPTRELRFFRLLLENRLDRIELLNPIKDLEIEIDPSPENERQEGFEDHTTLDQTKLAMLTSLLAQEGAQAGFAALQDEVWPENTWIVNPDSSRATPARLPKVEGSGFAHGDLDETGFAPKFHYAAALEEAPRPALLLKNPREISDEEISRLKFYSRHPIERIEQSWWEGRAGPPGTPTPGVRRDYYIARDSHGRNLWVYRDTEKKFFLHGAFD